MNKLYNDDAARRAGIEPSTWRAYCSPRNGKPPFGPTPDGVDHDRGHARPWWRPETVDAWRKDRPGQGARTDRPRRPGPTTAQRRDRKRREQDPAFATQAIRSIVIAHDEDMTRQRLADSAEVDHLVDTIRDLWLANPDGHPNGLRGFIDRWLSTNYHRWCDQHASR